VWVIDFGSANLKYIKKMKSFIAFITASAAMAFESQILENQQANDLPEAFEDVAELVEAELPGFLGQTNCCKAFNVSAGLSSTAANGMYSEGYNTMITLAY
jgi:hypothetical protein